MRRGPAGTAAAVVRYLRATRGMDQAAPQIYGALVGQAQSEALAATFVVQVLH